MIRIRIILDTGIAQKKSQPGNPEAALPEPYVAVGPLSHAGARRPPAQRRILLLQLPGTHDARSGRQAGQIVIWAPLVTVSLQGVEFGSENLLIERYQIDLFSDEGTAYPYSYCK